MAPAVATRSLAVIIPVYDEEQSLLPLYRELSSMAEGAALAVQVIFVDDGSRDDSWQVLEGIAAADERVLALRLRRNFGKTAAIAAGLACTDADVIALLDGDGQDDPAEIPALLKRLDEGFDVVNGYKRKRRDSLGKIIASRLFNLLVGMLTGLKLKDHNCGLKCVRAEVFEEIRLTGNLHRFIPVLAHSRGFSVTELPVEHRPRRHGHSHYGLTRLVTGLLDVILVRFLTDYRGRPQHLLGTFGLFSLAVGVLSLGYLAYSWLTQFWDSSGYQSVAARPLTLYGLGALLVGAQMVSLGIIAGLVAASGQERPEYSVRQTTRAELAGPLARPSPSVPGSVRTPDALKAPT